MSRAVANGHKPVFRRVARAIALGSTAALVVTLAAPSAHALVINTYTSGFSGDQLALIANAVQFYQTTFSDAITVNIGIENCGSTCLGESQSYVYEDTYADYAAKLAADATSTDDATALSSLAVDPSDITTGVTMKTANARAVGFGGVAAAGGPKSGLFCSAIPGLPSTIDACIGVSGPQTSTTPNTAGKYYFLTVLEHEMDEVLGLGSDLEGDGSIFTSQMAVEDLFRYNGTGSREFALHTCTGASPGHGPTGYFSIDGGTTDLANYNNCTNGGDYGDYVFGNSPPQVQDAFGTQDLGLSLSSTSTEVRDLDILGYTRITHDAITTPEPATIALLATGMVGLAGFARRRKTAAK